MEACASYLQSQPYPGRGILFGKTADGMHAVAVYFIMGRSENSRNRVFIPTDDGIRTAPYRVEEMEDPSLILYTPVRECGNILIVSNGDHTDTMYDCLHSGQSFHTALMQRTYEHDAPHYTPRISGLLKCGAAEPCLQFATLYRSDTSNGKAGDDSCIRIFYHYNQMRHGTGYLLQTYAGIREGRLLPYTNAPILLELPCTNDIVSFTDQIWNSLSPDNKVSLFVRFLALDGSAPSTQLRNKRLHD